MSNNLISFDPANRCRLGLLRVARSSLIPMLLSISPASSQSSPDVKPGDGFNDLSRLYECGSYYTVINFCFKRGRGKATEEMNAVALRNRDKIIHLIFLNSHRAGVLPETSLSNMQSSFNDMLKEMDHKCDKLDQLTSELRPSCDKIIKDVSQPPYDKGERSGSLEGFVPTSME